QPRRVRRVQLPPSVPPHPHQAHVPQHAQVLGHRRLLERQRDHNRRYGLLAVRQERQNRPPPRLRHRVERIGGCRRPCHRQTIHSHMGICQEKKTGRQSLSPTALFAFLVPPAPRFWGPFDQTPR